MKDSVFTFAVQSFLYCILLISSVDLYSYDLQSYFIESLIYCVLQIYLIIICVATYLKFLIL